MTMVTATTAAGGITTCICESSSLSPAQSIGKGRGHTTPSRFGASIGTISMRRHQSSLSNLDTSNREDCPVCKKFSQGPCGPMFRAWMACTDQYPGPNPDNPEEDWHLSKCMHLAKPLGACLEEHQAHYAEMDVYAEDDDDEQELMDAWSKVISEVEVSREAVPFLSPPNVQIKLANRTGMASFEYSLANKNIILAYVKDDETGELLAAGSSDDLWDYKGKGILRLSFGASCKSVTVFALYSDEHDNDILYKLSQRIPEVEHK
jgi:hypothetical protein